MKRYRTMLSLVVATFAVAAVWAFAIQPASLTVRNYRLALPDWHPELAGLRVAVLADLHVGSPFNGIKKLRKIVSVTNAIEPDLILIPGDLVIQGVLGGDFVSPEDTAAVLAELRAPLGVWACLGNHDWWLDPARVRSAIENQGISVLEDTAVPIERGGAHFWLIGLSDYWEGAHDFRAALYQVRDDAPRLLFTHNPDIFPEIKDRFSLLIAGHTHGGQVALPIIGAPIVPSDYGDRYAAGHVIENDRHLFVSSGLGTSILPVRFGVPPEISVLELHPQYRRALKH